MRKPPKKAMYAALLAGAEYVLKNEDGGFWHGFVGSQPHGAAAIQLFWNPLCVHLNDAMFFRRHGAYQSAHEKCVALCMAAAMCEHEITVLITCPLKTSSPTTRTPSRDGWPNRGKP